MRVFICQLKRIFRAPFFLGLLAVFLAFDLYLVFSEASGHKNDWENCRRSVNMVNSVAEETGTKINSTDFKKKFAVVLDSHKRDLKSFYHQKTGKESDDLSVMLDSLEGNIYQMTRGEKNRLYDDTTVLNMENILQNRFGVYRNTDFKKDGETYIHEEKLEGFQAEFIRKNSAASIYLLMEKIKHTTMEYLLIQRPIITPVGKMLQKTKKKVIIITITTRMAMLTIKRLIIVAAAIKPLHLCQKKLHLFLLLCPCFL